MPCRGSSRALAKPAQRLFFALWPPAETARRIHQHTRGLLPTTVGRRLAADQLHVTLAYLGQQSADQQQCAMDVADRLELVPFTLSLDHAGHFARAGVVWLGANHLPSPLVTLQTQLVSQLKTQCGYQPETRPYRPHVTLWRKVNRFVPSARPLPPIQWRVCAFVLARSESLDTGVRYSVIRSWPAPTAQV